jgi:hypothetical protein
MEQIKKFSKYLSPIYWPWYIDITISVASVISILYFLNLIFSESENTEIWNSIIAVVTFVYSVFNSLRKINNEYKQKENFKIHLGPFFSKVQTVVTTHIRNPIDVHERLKNRIITTFFNEWKKFGEISSFEYQILDYVVRDLTRQLDLPYEDQLFIKHALITSEFQIHFPILVKEMRGANYFSHGSPHNRFIRKLFEFTRTGDPLYKLSLPDIDESIIEDTVNFALNDDSKKIKTLIQAKESRERIDFLLTKCFENAYTNIVSLQAGIDENSTKKLSFLFKYDERFSIQRRKWKTEIKNHYGNQSNNNSPQKAMDLLDEIISPYPFSHALSDFSYCIKKLAPKDNFCFIIYSDKFLGEEHGYTPQEFMEYRVIPTAQEHLDNLNEKLVNRFPFLRGFQKKSLDANYYLFEFDLSKFSYHASQDAIPETIKRFLISDILDSEDAGNIVASQLVYLKQIINHLTLSGLLFTESNEVQKQVRKIESKLLKELEKQGVQLRNIYDFMSIGNQYNDFEKLFHKYYHKIELKRRYGKKYNETKHLASTIVENAKDIVSIFNSFQSSQSEYFTTEKDPIK